MIFAIMCRPFPQSMTVVKVAESAQRELLDSLTWIAQDNPRKALGFIDELQHDVRKILETPPLSGRLIAGGSRYIVVSGRVVAYDYQADTDEVFVLHIYALGQDWH